MNAQILLIDDHEIMRRAIGRYVQNSGYGLWGTAANATDALRQLREAEADDRRELPDIIVVDISLPDMTGIQFVARATAIFPTVRCLILTAHGEEEYVEQALAAGARGYIKKGAPEDVARAVAAVLAGGTFVARRDQDE